MNELLTFCTNNGIAVVLMFYFLRNNHKATTDLIKQNINLVVEIKEIISEIKEIKRWQRENIKVVQNLNNKLHKLGS